jgi:histone acetyltransferase (RNA polymerase elongator complex component)
VWQEVDGECIIDSVSVLQEFFENPAFRSDGLKLYPTLVIRGTGWSLFFVSFGSGHGAP